MASKILVALILRRYAIHGDLSGVVKEFQRAVAAGEQPHPRILAALSEAFNSGKVQIARNTGRPRGVRGGERKDHRDWRLAVAVQNLRDDGIKRTAAITRVRKTENVSFSAVDKAYTEYGHLIRGIREGLARWEQVYGEVDQSND